VTSGTGLRPESSSPIGNIRYTSYNTCVYWVVYFFVG
jgi:hypothetical protein